MKTFYLNPSEDQEDLLPETEVAWVHPELLPRVAALHHRFAARALSVAGGRNRNTFLMPGNYVVKLPKSWEGYGDNDWEGSISNAEENLNSPYHVQYPKTRLLYVEDIPILFMEKVKPIYEKELIDLFEEIPDWVHCVDCGQVGITKKGRLVAFDYGLN